MVKALKGNAINGHFFYEIAGKLKRFDQSNIQEFVDRIPRALAKNIARHIDGQATLVPIPNAHVVASDSPDFAPLSWPRLSPRIAEERSKSLRHLFLPSRRRPREKEGRATNIISSRRIES
jgi:hypothetical protein